MDLLGQFEWNAPSFDFREAANYVFWFALYDIRQYPKALRILGRTFGVDIHEGLNLSEPFRIRFYLDELANIHRDQPAVKKYREHYMMAKFPDLPSDHERYLYLKKIWARRDIRRIFAESWWGFDAGPEWFTPLYTAIAYFFSIFVKDKFVLDVTKIARELYIISPHTGWPMVKMILRNFANEDYLTKNFLEIDAKKLGIIELSEDPQEHQRIFAYGLALGELPYHLYTLENIERLIPEDKFTAQLKLREFLENPPHYRLPQLTNKFRKIFEDLEPGAIDDLFEMFEGLGNGEIQSYGALTDMLTI